MHPEILALSTYYWFAIRKYEDLYYLLKLNFIKKAVQKLRTLNGNWKKTFFNSTDLVEKLISDEKKVIRYPLNGTWIDIGNPQEYEKANDLVKHL